MGAEILLYFSHLNAKIIGKCMGRNFVSSVLGRCCRKCVQLLTLLTSLGDGSSEGRKARRETVSIWKADRDTAHLLTLKALPQSSLLASLRVLVCYR